MILVAVTCKHIDFCIQPNEARNFMKSITFWFFMKASHLEITLTYGGDLEDSEEKLPPILTGLLIAAAIIYFILLIHFRNVNIALLIFACMTLCVFGTAVGVLVQGVDFGVTSILGVVSLMGIIVRNGIIMIDYAEELRKTEKLGVRDAIYHSARRRMRVLEATPGFEPGRQSFADSCLTTWLCRRILSNVTQQALFYHNKIHLSILNLHFNNKI